MIGKLIIKWIMLASNFVAAFFMLMSLLGTVISPEKFIFPAYFTLIFPIAIAVNIGFVVFWLLVRKWFFLISLSLLLYSSAEISNTFPIHLGKKKSIELNNSFSILSFNTMGSGSLKKHTKKKPNKVIQYILDSNADIVCLQEFAVSDLEEYFTYNDIGRIFYKYPYKHIEFKLREGSRRSGNATFSKYPILLKKTIEYPANFNSSIYTDINVKGTRIRFVNNHLESNRITEKDKAMPLSLKDKFDTENLTGITRHLSRKLAVAYKRRAFQADAVANVIDESPYKVITCGDFNDVPSSYAYTTVKGNLKDAFSETGTGFGWTFNDKFYHFRIDYILYDSDAFSVVDFKSDAVDYSDHYPVHCKINIDSPSKTVE
ncbi:MAG: endonuclease/exonuclease/phosphatase family protein [Paludibacter sp.]|nr:endonuclease/exonuclease/phosphatase family protein [Paludibacter sp.]